ncbi:MAG: hypothetical protein ABIO44_01880 [Saprospiraceae bacterium]
MKKRRNLNYGGIFLILIYLLSNSPTIIFHHHNHEIVAYNKADNCEKAIYYADKSGKCNHKSHLSKSLDKCALCDNHIFQAHFNHIYDFTSAEIEISNIYNSYLFNFKTIPFSETSNRGPPTV